MTFQFLSQLAQTFDSLDIMCRFRAAESNLSDEALQGFRLALDQLKQDIKDLCSKMSITITPVIKNFGDLPPSIEVPESLKGQASECMLIEPDAELPNSYYKMMELHKEFLKQERKRLIHLVDNMRDPKDPVTSTEISIMLTEQIFAGSSELLPIEKIRLFQQVCDEIFGYGPLGPYMRVFTDIRITEDGSYKAGERCLKIEFDDELHREETLALLKYYAKRVTTDDGNVEYSNPQSWKITMPPHMATAIDQPKTRLEKLGWSQEIMTVRTNTPSPLQKVMSWFTGTLSKK